MSFSILRPISALSSEASAKLEKKEDTKASEKELDDVLLQIRKNKAHFDYHEKHPEDKTHNHAEIKDEDLPVLDDEFAKNQRRQRLNPLNAVKIGSVNRPHRELDFNGLHHFHIVDLEE